jgi:hypothetical protein
MKTITFTFSPHKTLLTWGAAFATWLLSCYAGYAQISATISLTGSPGSFNSGSVNAGGTKNDGNLTSISSTNSRGWAQFDLSAIPVNATIISAELVFTAYSSTTSSGTNTIHGFTGSPASIPGTALYDSCGFSTSFYSAPWTANATNTLPLNSDGLLFLNAQIGGTANLGFRRGSGNVYNIYGYPGTTNNRPQLRLSYSINAAMIADSSLTDRQETAPVRPGTSDVAISRLAIYTSGALTPLTLSDLTVGTGSTTTSLTDIPGLKVYYTGSDPEFNTTSQFGSTITSVGSLQMVSGSQVLTEGINYFWVAYDLLETAAPGTVLDAEITAVTIDGSTTTPIITNATGTREIQAAMTYVSSFAFHSDTSLTAPGNFNVNILGVAVVMSPTGLPVILDTLVFNTNGTTSPPDVADAQVWYTGSDKTFATDMFFGSLGSSPASPFTISGNQPLNNDTNYFWLTYDLDPAAISFDTIDAECELLGIEGITYVPAITAPDGSRKIDYCTSMAQFPEDEHIINVNFGSIDNASDCFTTGGEGSVMNQYSNYTQTVPPADVLKCQSVPFNISIGSCGDFWGGALGVFIDWNADGDFDDAEEQAFSSAFGVGTEGQLYSGNITVPSFATTGITRMRIIYVEDVVAMACGPYGWGETEDYSINILENPSTFISGTALQQTVSVAPGTNDWPVLRIPVVANSCEDMTATSFHFKTTGTTSASDISMAKLYVTGNSPVFNTSKLAGSVASPNGVFVITTLDTLVNNDTTNYWLAYDVPSGAVVGNSLDAVFDSIEAVGAFHIPTVSTPAGNVTIENAMTYISSTTTQADSATVAEGSSNNRIIGIEIETSPAGAPIILSQLDFNANGTIDTSSIHNIKVWYTGNSSTFATNVQFGSTLPNLPGLSALDFSITGYQPLTNGTNHFWLSYDITNPATISSEVDAECVAMIVDGNVETPSVTAPNGSRMIRSEYCIPEYSDGSFSCFMGTYLNSVSTSGGITDINNINSGCVGTASMYNYFTNQLLTVKKGSSVSLTIDDNGFDEQDFNVWIDFDQNGIFDLSEVVLTSSMQSLVTRTITIPCSAKPGMTRMRVRSAWLSTPSDGCADFWLGESEDYDVMILPAPVTIEHITAEQQTGSYALGSTDVPVLRVPVLFTGCDTGIVTELRFNTDGSTAAASDITSAKLYRTGNTSTFNTSTLIGTVSAPSGPFMFIVSDTLLAYDTTNYWLAYDIAMGATLGNVVDARLDSVEALGSFVLPVSSDPAGNVLLDVAMTYVSATVVQNETTRVGQGSSDNAVASLVVEMSSTGSAEMLTAIEVYTNGTSSLTDISNLKIWYSGSSNKFSTATQFGSTVASPIAAQTVTGSQPLVSGLNHFWITYDITPGAVIGNITDAEIPTFTVAGNIEIPAVTAPSGSREIRADHCRPSYLTGTADGDYISRVQLGTINHTTGASASPYYNFYNTQNTTLLQGGYYTLSLVAGTYTENDFGAWIDYNDDGDFTEDEKLGELDDLYSMPDVGTITFAVPLNAVTGTLKMRIVEAYAAAPGVLPCDAYDYGETEDYTVTILPAPPQTVYVWNKTAPAAFDVAANWTPSRNNPNMNDVLKFTAGGSAFVTDVTDHRVAHIAVENASVVTLSTNDVAELVASDSLSLVSGKLITDVDLTLSLGSSETATGTLAGTGSIEGSFSRWIEASAGSYVFPMSSGTHSRALTVDYTTAPTDGGKLTASYITGNPGSSGLPLVNAGLNLENISDDGVWSLMPDMNISGGTFDISVQADNIAGVNDITQTSLLTREDNTFGWVAPGVHLTTTGSASAMLLKRTGLTGYGEIGIAGTVINPLPVTLLSFTAFNKNGDVALSWITASEYNNSGFEVERSVDGHSFENITFVKGKGTVNSRSSYALADKKAFALTGSNTLYYRLRQLDVNGTYAYSTIAVVSAADSRAAASVHPNPFSSTYAVTVDAEGESTAILTLTDIQGRIITEQTVTVRKGQNTVLSGNLDMLRAGIYFLKVSTAGEIQVLKLIKD